MSSNTKQILKQLSKDKLLLITIVLCALILLYFAGLYTNAIKPWFELQGIDKWSIF